MNNALRVINVLVLMLVLVHALASPPGGGDGSTAYALGSWLGLVLVTMAPLMALLGLRARASSELRHRARRINALILTLFAAAALLAGAGAFASGGIEMAARMVGLLVFCIPCALNYWRLRLLSRPGTQEEPARGWFVARYWRGEYSLTETIWAGGAMVGLFLFTWIAAFGMLSERLSMRAGAQFLLLMFGALLCSVTWHAVSVWRSASRRSQAGAGLWPRLAKAGVVVGLLVFATFVTIVAPRQLREHALIALGRDPLPPLEASVTTNGTVLLLHGTFGGGSADKVRRMLEANPTIETVALASPGGRLREASDVAELVRERRLNTYVDSRCESACTFVFLAGKDRAATPNARIGFHRPSFPGLNPFGQAQATERMLATYRLAGIPKAFLARVAATEFTSMWYPSPAELEKAGVINRVSLGGEASTLHALAISTRADLARAFRDVPMLVAMDRHFPGTLEAAVRAAWMEQTQGGVDTAVGNAARDVVSERYPRLLAAASNESLDVFARLMLDQMKEARAVSIEACRLLMLGQLNVVQVLSPSLVKREHDWALGILDAETLNAREPVDAAAFERAMAEGAAALSPESLEALGDPERFEDDPRLRCDSLIALYEGIVGLPPAPRHLVLRGMFQSAAP